MKKVIAIILCLIIILPIGYFTIGLPKKVVGESDIYTSSEIKDAMSVAKKEVKGFAGVMLLLKIKYNETKSLKVIEGNDELSKENSIVILVDFATNFKTLTLNPMDIYEGYQVILKREGKDSAWAVYDSGY